MCVINAGLPEGAESNTAVMKEDSHNTKQQLQLDGHSNPSISHPLQKQNSFAGNTNLSTIRYSRAGSVRFEKGCDNSQPNLLLANTAPNEDYLSTVESRREGTMCLYDAGNVIRKEPLEDYYDVGNELGRYVSQ